MIQIELNKTNELLTVERKKNADYPDIYNYLNSVSYMNLDTFLEKGSTILYVGRPSCDDCNKFEPEFIKYISEHKLTNKLTYLNVNEVQKKSADWENFKRKYDIKYTPTLALFKEGVLVTKTEWTPENDFSINQINKWLSENSIK